MSSLSHRTTDAIRTPADAWAMLSYIPADERDTWVRVGMALKAALGDGGFSVFDSWSATAHNYSPTAARDVWRSFKGGAIGPGTLLYIAQRYGWRPQERAVSSVPTPVPKATHQFTGRDTAKYAAELWLAADFHDAAVAEHPYAQRKKIRHAAGAARVRATGKLVGRDADCLCVPMRTLDGVLTGVECINPDGVKQSFGRKGVLILGNDLDPRLPQLVVEGWATAVAILGFYNWDACLYACFGKSMLERFATEVALKYPDRTVIIGGERD